MARKLPCRELPEGARQLEGIAIRPGAGDDESPGRAPYSADERRGHASRKLGGNAESFRPRGWGRRFFIWIKLELKTENSEKERKHLP